MVAVLIGNMITIGLVVLLVRAAARKRACHHQMGRSSRHSTTAGTVYYCDGCGKRLGAGQA